MIYTHNTMIAPITELDELIPATTPTDDSGPLSLHLLAMLTIAMGVAACLWGAIGIVVDGNPAPNSAIAMVGTGICFIATGSLMFTRSLMLPLITAVVGILLGIASQTMF